MEIAFFWFLFSIAVGVWAHNKGRSGLAWFVLSLLISPLLGLVFCAVSRDLTRSTAALPTDDTHVKCNACAEYVLPDANVCRHCGAALVARPQHAKERARQRDDLQTRTNRIYIGTLAALGLVAWLILNVFGRG